MTKKTHTTHDVFIANLAFDATHDQLHELGAKYGGVVHVHIVTDKESKRPKGYGFIRYRTRAEAEACITGIDGVDFLGRKLRSNWGRKKAAG